MNVRNAIMLGFQEELRSQLVALDVRDMIGIRKQKIKLIKHERKKENDNTKTKSYLATASK